MVNSPTLILTSKEHGDFLMEKQIKKKTVSQHQTNDSSNKQTTEKKKRNQEKACSQKKRNVKSLELPVSCYQCHTEENDADKALGQDWIHCSRCIKTALCWCAFPKGAPRTICDKN